MQVYSGENELVMLNNDKLGVVILNYNDSEHVRQLIQRIKSFSAIDYVIIVDNCSTDGSRDLLSKLEGGKIIVVDSPRNGGYGYGNNFGIKYAKEKLNCKFAIIANPDVDFTNETVLALKAACEKNSDKCAIVACRQINTYAKHTKSAWKAPTSYWNWVLSSGKILSHLTSSMWYAENHFSGKAIVPVDCVQGAMLLVDIDKFLSVGGYDESIFLYCEEVDLALKIKEKGFNCLFLPNYTYYHYHSQSISKSFPSLKKQQRLILQSQTKIMRKYWKISKPEWMVIKVIFFLSEWELGIIGWIKQIKKQINS